MLLNSFYKYSLFKKRFATLDREPFFDIASTYIGEGEKHVVDIGSGEAEFFHYLKKKGHSTKNLYLLDANGKTVEENKTLTGNALLYVAPEKLPFDDRQVDMVHMSHLLDNLPIGDMYLFLFEIDRVLKKNGVIVISTPMLWPMFYNDLSHTKPYNPYVFYKYFIQPNKSGRFEKVPGMYEMVELVYRYYETPLDEGWSFTSPYLDYALISFRRLLRKAGLKRLQKNGYTLVIRKINE